MNEEFDGSYSEPNKEYYQNINDYNQIFVDTVRKTGDNNTKRWLIIPGWNTNIDYTAGDYGFKLPADQYRDKSIDKEEQRIMISVHYYSPWDFCGGENGVITQWGNETDAPSKTSKTCEITQPAIIDVIMDGFGQKTTQNSSLMSARLYVSDSKYWATIALKDCDVELGNQTKSDFANAQIVIDKVCFNGTDYTVKENKNDNVFSEKGSLQMELINPWSEAEPLIEGLTKKRIFFFPGFRL